MAFRGTESPMDFEWQSHGPVDVTSPFHKHAMENQRKRNHAQIASPQKPSMPTLREPNSQPWFFSNPPRAAETSPFRAPSFTTPRKPVDFDFSSGPESSPMDQADIEYTPDGKPLPPLPNDLPLKSKRNSLFSLYGRFAPSPGRGEIKKPPSSAIARRIQKRRRRAQDFDRQLVLDRRASLDTSDDDESRPSTSDSKRPARPTQELGWIAGFFTFLHTYPDAPSIIAKYLQVFFNGAILFGCLFMLWSFYATIRADVDRASDEAVAELIAEITACSNNYIDNRCAANSRPPALETFCATMQLCMEQDPKAVKRARLGARTFAEIFNSFVEPISLKTMIFTVTLVALGLLINNVTFSMYRQSQQHQTMGTYHAAPGYPVGGQSQHPGQFPGTPGYSYGQQQMEWHMPSGHRENRQLDYQQSPTKHNSRSRSRSPEKKLLKM